MLSTVCVDPVTDSLKQIWELESMGIIDKEDAHMSLQEDECVRQFINKGLKFSMVMRYHCCGKKKTNYFQAVKKKKLSITSKIFDPTYHTIYDQSKNTVPRSLAKRFIVGGPVG